MTQLPSCWRCTPAAGSRNAYAHRTSIVAHKPVGWRSPWVSIRRSEGAEVRGRKRDDDVNGTLTCPGRTQERCLALTTRSWWLLSLDSKHEEGPRKRRRLCLNVCRCRCDYYVLGLENPNNEHYRKSREFIPMPVCEMLLDYTRR